MTHRRENPPAGWDAETYHDVAAPQESWGRELLEAYPWRGDETVLDAGCGSGRLTALLLEKIPRGRLISVDGDEGMIAKARETLADFIAADRVRLHCCDLLDFRSPDPVDVVFSNAVFHWIPDHDRLWRQCFAWLKPGGRLHVQCGGEGNVEAELALAERLANAAPYGERLRGFERGHYFASAEATRRRLEEAGFGDVEVFLTTKRPRFASRAEFERFVAAVILRRYRPPLGELWERFFREWSDAYVEQRGLVLHYVRLNARAARP